MDLVELICVVECHLLDILRFSVAYVRVGLAWLRVDNPAGINAHLQDLFNFGLGGTVKASAEGRQKSDDLRIGITLNG